MWKQVTRDQSKIQKYRKDMERRGRNSHLRWNKETKLLSLPAGKKPANERRVEKDED
jgi:hypothetical protein